MREYPAGHSTEPHPQRWLILFVLCTSLLLVFVSVTSVNVALPTMQTALSASVSDLQWITDSYILTSAGLLLPFGALGDRLGRKGVLLAGIVIFGAFSTLTAFSTSAGEVVIYRAITGVGSAPIMPATLSITAVLFPASERPKAVAIWSAFAMPKLTMRPHLRAIMWGATRRLI